MDLDKELLIAVYTRAAFSSRLQSWVSYQSNPTITLLCFYLTVTESAAPNDIATDHPLSSPVTYHLLWLLEEIWPFFFRLQQYKKPSFCQAN